jgi:hypothetical protein
VTVRPEIVMTSALVCPAAAVNSTVDVPTTFADAAEAAWAGDENNAVQAMTAAALPAPASSLR